MSEIKHIARVGELPHDIRLAGKRGGSLSVEVGGVRVGGASKVFVAGPCAVESEEQLWQTASAVREAGADILRGGAFKPRTSPYDFQGLRAEGVELLAAAGKEFSMPVASEITDIRLLDLFVEKVDLIQVGSRNMFNYTLLRELGKTDKPVMLKRGGAATLAEWLLCAEYIMSEGNENVILCERGIKSFESFTRNTLDLSAVVAVKELSRLPVLVDPSHASGISWMVAPLARAGLAAGADGVMVEVHCCPSEALCDAAQAITPEVFAEIVKSAATV